MTTDYLCPLWDNSMDTRLLLTVAEMLAWGRIPDQICQILRIGRMTTLRKEGEFGPSLLEK